MEQPMLMATAPKRYREPLAQARAEGYDITNKAKSYPDPGNSYCWLVLDPSTRLALIVNIGDGMFPAFVDECDYLEAVAIAQRIKEQW